MYSEREKLLYDIWIVSECNTFRFDLTPSLLCHDRRHQQRSMNPFQMNACNSSSNSNNIISNSNNNIISSKNLKSKFFNFKADLLQRQQQQRRRRRHEPRQRFCAQNFSRVGSTCSKPVTWPQREDEGVRAKVATLTTKAAFRARSKRVRAKFKCLQLFFCARVTLHPDTLAPLLLTCIGIFSSLSVGLSSCPTAFPLPPSLSLSLSLCLSTLSSTSFAGVVASPCCNQKKVLLFSVRRHV